MIRAAIAGLAGIVTFFLLAPILLSQPMLPDTDSYFHLAVARLYATHGFVNELPWARFSVMHEHYGDKELLFHALLVPFTRGDAATNARLAIAAFNAVIAMMLVLLGMDVAGRWGALLAPLLYVAAPYFWSRSIRLRPELLSLILLLALVLAARRGKIRTAAILACAYALSYTAFHLVAGLALLWAVATRQWKVPVAIVGGLIAGLLVHPHFPDNLNIWWLQNVRFMLAKGTLDVGAEIGPPKIALLLLHNAGWFLAAAIALMALRPRRPDAWIGIPAAVFTVMQLAMERMSIYFFPFASLALLNRRDERWPRRTWGIAIVLATLASVPFALASLRYLERRVPADLERDYAAMARHLPPGAKVAARWGATDAYVFFAPQARFLNALDPIFMAAPHPAKYAALQRIFNGEESDIAAMLEGELDSDYLAFPKFEAAPRFLARVNADSRLERVYDGYNVVYRVRQR